MKGLVDKPSSSAPWSVRWRLVVLVWMALLIAAPSLFWREIPERDSATYALMTNEFAQGNYARAFHPSTPPLLVTIGGSLAHLVSDPFRANRIASILLFLLGIPGTFLLVKELAGARIANVAAVLYAFCPQILYLATSGGVDAGKLSLLPWLTWAGLHWYRRQAVAWGMAVGALGALISLARGEGIFFVIAVLCWYLIETARQKPFRYGSMGRSLTSLVGAVAVMLLLLYPWLSYQRSQTGLWITHPTQLRIYAWLAVHNHWQQEMIVDNNAMEITATAEPASPSTALATTQTKLSTPKGSPDPSVSRDVSPTVPPAESVDQRDNRKNVPWFKNLEKVAKGAFIPYLVLAVGGFVWRRSKDMPLRQRGGSLPLFLIALNLAIFYPTNIMAPRYVSATIPLFLHLSATGVLACETTLQRWSFFTRRRLRLAAVAGIVILALLSQTQLDLFMPPHKRGEQLALMRLGNWIRQHAHEFPTYGTLPSLSFYHNGRVPIMLETDGRLRYYARTDGLVLFSFYRYRPSQITTICRQGKVSVIAYDERMEALCPGFGQYWRNDPSYVPVNLGQEKAKIPESSPVLLCFQADGGTPR
ncbi:MAG TPA: hypothetical protein DEO88_01320 [Syntrophobacteraceae bacterium]|nr:hypothetical protein [Syntrophobacteraceae bacterium]